MIERSDFGLQLVLIYRWEEVISRSPKLMLVYKVTLHSYDNDFAQYLESHSMEITGSG